MQLIRILWLCFVLFSFTSGQGVAPTNKTEVLDGVQPAQTKRDGKIFKNVLCVYQQIRQTAEGTVKILNNVSDYAYKSYFFLKKLESMAVTAKSIKENIKAYKNIKWYDGVKLVEHTYENIYCNGTDLLLAQGVNASKTFANLHESRKEIGNAAKDIGAVWAGKDKVKSSMSKASKDPALYKSQYQMTQALSLYDQELMEKHSYRPEVKRMKTTMAVAADGVAGAAVRSEIAENQTLLAKYAMSSAAGPGGDDQTSIAKQTAAEAVAAQNQMFGSLAEHETMNGMAKVLAITGLNKMDAYLMTPYVGKIAMAKMANSFSAEIEKYENAHKK